MSYATYNSFTSRVGPRTLAQLTAETGTTPSNSVITAQLLTASRKIDLILSTRYVVPVTGPVGTLPQLAVLEEDITLWMLWADFRGIGDQESAAAAAKFGYDEAMKILNAIADGDRDLPGVALRPADTSTTTGAVGWTSNAVVYTSTGFRGF